MPELAFVMVPIVVFTVVVAPIWLVLHYRSKRRAETSLAAEDREEVEALCEQVERMAQRIETLETILDAQAPRWRDQSVARR